MSEKQEILLSAALSLGGVFILIYVFNPQEIWTCALTAIGGAIIGALSARLCVIYMERWM